MMGEALVEFFCMAGAHLDGKDGVDHLTIHESHWAYCPGNARAPGHEWQSTGAKTLRDVETYARQLRVSEKVR